jgi:hypothetical protein
MDKPIASSPSRIIFVLIVSSLIGSRDMKAAEPTSAPTATNPPPISGKLGTPIQLFNGKTIDQWTWVPRQMKTSTTQPTQPAAEIPNPFSVRDGVLHDAGKPIGYLRTEQSFDNYVLTVEQRHLAKGNGGILFAITGPDIVWPHGLEAQGQSGEEADIRGIGNFHLTMDPARTEAKRLRRMESAAEKPIAEWETVQVIVDHGNLSVTLNGQLANVATYDPAIQSLAGRIAIQAEGGEMEFRKLELTPIK